MCLCPSLPCCDPLLLLCLCVVCCCSSNVKRIPNPVPTKALPVVLVVLLGAVFSPSPCFLPPSPSLLLLMSFFGCLWLLPGGPFVGVGWSSLHLHVHPSSNLTRSVRAGVCVCTFCIEVKLHRVIYCICRGPLGNIAVSGQRRRCNIPVQTYLHKWFCKSHLWGSGLEPGPGPSPGFRSWAPSCAAGGNRKLPV